jgi:cell wall-associated NlpC family hydrolase
LGARAFILPFALAGVVLFSVAPSTPAAASTYTTEAQQIIRIAKAQLGDPWVYAAQGPRSFDCSGLVRYAFRRSGNAAAIHTGYLRSARSLYMWFRAHGKTTRTNPHVGDLVIWGYGSHVGIYIGNGKAISTLTSGVRIHRVHAVTARFTAYLRTGMSTKPAS